ncbi:kinase-like domain-containing protein [Mycena epipterygia]|nr:kinase-like domain-containing protein [Mycena epipterygia]
MDSQKFYKEVLLWQSLRHKYILPLIGFDRESFPSDFCMVSPWMKHGTILNYLKGHKDADIDDLLLQVAEGLNYLHSMKVVHGDLRGTNILISDDCNVCLADFGLSVISEVVSASPEASTRSTSSRAGSVRWFAPELIYPVKFGHDTFKRTPATDVYAYSCVCLELYTGLPPFHSVSDVEVIFKVVNGDRPPRHASMSIGIWKLVKAAWAQSASMRPSLEAIIGKLRSLKSSFPPK